MYIYIYIYIMKDLTYWGSRVWIYRESARLESMSPDKLRSTALEIHDCHHWGIGVRVFYKNSYNNYVLGDFDPT
jgi:hypothetical protein